MAFRAEHREIRAWIAQDDVGLELAPVDKRHLHLVHVLDDVIVGDDETRRIHDDTGAKRTLRPRRRRARAALPEEPPIEILHAGILTPLGAAGIDIHHRAAGGANDGRERQLNLRLALRNRAVLRLCARKAYGEETTGREDKMAESGTHEDEIPSVCHKAGIRRGAPNAKFQRNRMGQAKTHALVNEDCY